MRLAPVALAAAAAIGLAACGSSDSKGDKAAPTSTPAAAARSSALTVSASEYAFDPSTIQTTAGKVALTLKNSGKIEHELVVLKTDAAPDSLKVSGGRVSEKNSVGEVSATKAGAETTTTLDLQPGTYVYVCNIPGHYADGMHGTLTVR